MRTEGFGKKNCVAQSVVSQSVSSFLLCLVTLHDILHAIIVCSPLLAEQSGERVVLQVPEGWTFFLNSWWKWNKHIRVIVIFCSPNVSFSFVSPSEMLESNNLVTFEGLANSSSYHTFLLDEEKGRLVVGAKDHIFTFNLLNIRDYAQVHPTSDFSISLSVFFFPSFVSIYAFTPNMRLLLTNFKSAPPPRAPVRSSGISGPSVLFPHKSTSCIFQTCGRLHTITCCVRTVRCSRYTWMNNGVNWNKVDNKSLCNLFNPHVRTQAAAALTCIQAQILWTRLFHINSKCVLSLLQIPWLASPTRRDECKWAGKDLSVRAEIIYLTRAGASAFHPTALLEMFGKMTLLFFTNVHFGKIYPVLGWKHDKY